MKQFNIKERRYFSMFLAIWSVFLILSGIFMNTQVKSVIQTDYSIHTDLRRISDIQAKTNEIKIKEIEIEIDTPISIDVRDYLLDVENLSDDAIRSLKLDTSLVNIHQAGDYVFHVTYQKKTYDGIIKVKEKELPNVTFTLKTISLNTKDSISDDPKVFVNEEILPEVYSNMKLDTSKVDTSTQGDYTYYITYKDIVYQGKVEVRDLCPTVVVAEEEKEKEKMEEKEQVVAIICPEDATVENQSCVCTDKEKTYDASSKSCK